MIGLVVGIAAGGLQYWLLSRFTARITRGTVDFRAVLYGIAQFFLPMGVLIGMALLRRQDLLWTAIGITGILILGAVGKFVLKAHKASRREEGNQGD